MAKEVGAIWIGKTQKGEKKLSLKIGDDYILGFENKFKTEDKHPDYRFVTFDDDDQVVDRGAGWEFEEDSGMAISLIIDEERLVARPVEEKRSENFPDYRIFTRD